MGSTEATTGIVEGGVLSGDLQHEDFAKRINELSEQLHRARLLRRFLVLWALLGNLVVAGLAAACFTVLNPPLWTLAAAVAVASASIVLSAIVLYRHHFKVHGMVARRRELRRAHREYLLDEYGADDLLGSHKRYRAQLPEAIERYRQEARKFRRRHTLVHGVTISGSIATSVLAGMSVSLPNARWPTVGMSLLVAITAASAGYSKFRERSANMQQTADALEREYHAVDLRVGRYWRFEDERAAYVEFAQAVEALLQEHGRRQQQLAPAVSLDVPL